MTSDELRKLADGCRSDGYTLFQTAFLDAADEIDRLTARVAELEKQDDSCFLMNSHQHDRDFHPFTCGNDSRHRPLVATRHGWRCADCEYVQTFGHPCEAMMGKKPQP